ncbi:2-oxoglutarate dehydrogenase complex dihydrolipoyllysine-residue succinyltransferase [Anaerobacillus sp. MEB173]|uniref:2-oxoglutarate dehydrogenase complex dihydrolipoyllysine-residue succinyltransferase n=1 Tax=Anaerobacillus sp. MEB173 TaxID=3383345 RepID=UPI003F8EE23D
MKEIKVPELAESVTEGTIAEWFKKEGEYVQKGGPLLELETDKVNLEMNSDVSGVIQECKKGVGETVEVGEVIAVIDESAVEQSDEKVSKVIDKSNRNDTEKYSTSVPSSLPSETKKQPQPIASPAARKRARELGIDLQSVTSRDPLGRIRLTDIEVNQRNKQNNQNERQHDIEEDSRIERIHMSRRRQTIANRLVEAQQTAAMLTTFNEVDMSAIFDIRKRRKDKFEERHDVKLGYMSFFTKAVVAALKAYPYVNAEIQGNDILLKKFYDIGIAVSANEGLVVPVVRNADQLSFAGIEKEILALSEKARTNSLSLNDLTGGTFTITNGGIFGSLYSTPILNTPQVGILGMHKIQRRPVVIDDQDTVEVRPMMYVALSYDHRIIDGKDAVQFLAKVKELLEDPEDLLLEG